MCAALLLPNCRDAFLRLSQLPSLRDRRFYSAILLAETQKCVSTSFRRTHDIYSVSSRKSLASKEDTVFLASNFCWEGIYARILSQNSLARNLRAYLVPKLRWEEIYARILSQNFAGKEFTRVSCPKTSLGRYRGAILAPNPRWEGVAARFLPQIFAGKVSRRDSCPKSSLGRCRGAILVPNPRWEGVAARFLLQIFAGKVSRRDSCPKSSLGRYRSAILAAWRRRHASRRCRDVACRVSLKLSRRGAYWADAGIPRISVKGRRGAPRLYILDAQKTQSGAPARSRRPREGEALPRPAARYRSILPPSEVTLATISSSPARLWSPGMVFLRALAERAKSRHRWLSSPHLPRACM